MVAAPAGAAAGCGAGEFPATFAAQSGLKVDCNSAPLDNVGQIVIHDAVNASWHHGTARTIATLARTVAGPTLKVSGVTPNVLSADDVGRPISGTGLPGGLFIKAVVGVTATVSQSLPIGPAIAAAKIDYTYNRWLIDAFCTASTPTNAIAPFTTTLSAEATTIAAAANGKTITQLAGHLPVVNSANFMTRGIIHVVDKTSGGAVTSDNLSYTASAGNSFTFTGGVGTDKVATGAAVTWLTSKLSDLGAGQTIGVVSAAGIPNGLGPVTGQVTVTTSLTAATLNYGGSAATPSRITGATFVSGPVTTATIAPGKVVTWLNASVAKLSSAATPVGSVVTVVTASNATNGFALPTAFTGPESVETTTGVGDGAFTGATGVGNTFTGVTGSGTGNIQPGYEVVGSGATGSTTLTSASAVFAAPRDVGKSVSGGPFGSGTWITAVVSPTQATLNTSPQGDCTTNSGGNPNSVHPIEPLVGADDIEIGATTVTNPTGSPNNPEMFNGSDSMGMELANNTSAVGGAGFTCAGSVLTLTPTAVANTGGFTGKEANLIITVTSVTGIPTPAGNKIKAPITNNSVTMTSPCPAGGVTATASPLTTAKAFIGVADANAPVNTAAMMTLVAEINLNPALVATQDDCQPGGVPGNATFEGFEVVGGWTSPGATWVNNTSAPPVATGQVLFPTSVLSFNGFVVPQAGGDSAFPGVAHYNFDFPVLPTSLAVCLNDTVANGGVPTDGTQLAFGMNATTLSTAPFLPTGSGNFDDPSVRSLLPETGGFVQKIDLFQPAGGPQIGSTFTSATCTISGPTVLPPLSLTTCGDG